MIIIDEQTKKLLEGMGFFPSAKDKMLYETEIENGKAYVDFRKVDGRRFAMINGKPVDDEDSIPILKQFKEERKKITDALLQIIGADSQSWSAESSIHKNEVLKDKSIETSISGTPDNSKGGEPILKEDTTLSTQGSKAPPAQTPNEAQQAVNTPKPPASQSQKKNVFLHEIATAHDIDICEFFGDAGSGKSQLAKQISLDAIAEGKKVMYIDTERGFLKSDIKKLGNAYQYVSNLKDILSLVQKIPKDIDVFVLDSVGYPVLTEWAKLGVNERGNALTQIIAIKDYIKDWAINNGKIAIVINQPDSDFGKEQGYQNRPFGDKGQFVIKEVFQIRRTKASNTEKTISTLESFRSRFEGRGTIVAQIEISSTGVKII